MNMNIHVDIETDIDININIDMNTSTKIHIDTDAFSSRQLVKTIWNLMSVDPKRESPFRISMRVSNVFFVLFQPARAPFFRGREDRRRRALAFRSLFVPQFNYLGAFCFAEAVFGPTTSRIGREAALEVLGSGNC